MATANTAKGNTTTKLSMVGNPSIQPVSSPHQYIGFMCGKPGAVSKTKGAPIAKATPPPNRQLNGTASQRFWKFSNTAYKIIVSKMTTKAICAMPIPSAHANRFLTCEMVPIKPRYNSKPPHTPLLVKFASKLPPLLMASNKPKAPISKPKAIG